jgi:uncharacterized protein
MFWESEAVRSRDAAWPHSQQQCPHTNVYSSCSVDNGFIVDEVRVEGPMVAHGSFWMMWKAESAESITRQHLSILELLRPAPELLVIGSGPQHTLLSRDTMNWILSTGTSVEVLPTVCSFA